jgi:hypothetical protein
MSSIRILALACLFSLASLGVAQAALIVQLLNHPDEPALNPYGLRLDNAGGLQTFNFDPASAPGVGVFMSFDTAGGDAAKIYGVVKHNESGQLWSIEAKLGSHLYTNFDALNWNASNSLYDDVINDMVAKARNEDAAGEGNLKEIALPADRLGWFDVNFQMDLLGGGIAVFELPGQPNGSITMYDTPQAPEKLPFMLVKGHRLGPASNVIAGIGWLDTRPPDEQDMNMAPNQDFLFVIGPTVPEPSSIVLALLGGLGLACVYRARRK